LRKPREGDLELRFIFDKKETFQDKVLLAGFHGLGRVGYLVVRHIVEEMEARRIGVIIPEEGFPPFISLKERMIIFPFEIYAKEDVIFIVTHFQPYHQQRQFSETLVDWISETGFRRVFLAGGVDARLKKVSQGDIRYVPTSKFTGEEEYLRSALLEPGLLVAGPLALTVGFCELKGIPALAILAYADPVRPDPFAASVVIKDLAKYIGREINTTRLIEDAARIERELEETRLQSQEEKEEPSAPRRLYI